MSPRFINGALLRLSEQCKKFKLITLALVSGKPVLQKRLIQRGLALVRASSHGQAYWPSRGHMYGGLLLSQCYFYQL